MLIADIGVRTCRASALLSLELDCRCWRIPVTTLARVTRPRHPSTTMASELHENSQQAQEEDEHDVASSLCRL